MESTPLLLRNCAYCGEPAPSPLAWQCHRCHGPYEYHWRPTFNPDLICRERWSQSRYQALLLPPAVPSYISLGEGMTPITTTLWDGLLVTFKLDYLMPTGSYKDRGSAVLISILQAEGHPRLVEDSSGNAGASIAAYAAAAGIAITIFVPSYTVAVKQAQIKAFGAEISLVEGSRTDATARCCQAAQQVMYASHIWHPAFLLGQMSGAWEVWEQMAQQVPDVVIMPVGQGNLFLGYYRGFRALLEANVIDRMPRFVAVQAAACAPLAFAWQQGLTYVPPVEEQPTVAAGIRTCAPVRGLELLRAVQDSDGFVLTVTDEAIRHAQQRLTRMGFGVEATSAVPVAAIAAVRQQVGDTAKILIPLSGTGLKEL